ncbi:hypothetical protein CYD26_24560 [Pseudomonas sp. FFUP_PS_473]|uniref:hypothetical protein n=1 Tax=Pseudomonas sp. FFUP_PS_473 TaxID=2060418 RepID=UPI000C7E3578|nr:hypothetical protein [Pseudomonas sp. FFUP_PS_473]PLP85787.1 hypothetical protein CYD26_24560 [Pseudomonas sp. FFUP_PS_473]
MLKMLSAVIPLTVLLGSLAGCAGAEKPVLVDNGPVRIQSALLNARLQENWSGSVKVISTDTHTEMANYLIAALKKAKYNVVTGNANVTFSIKEIYAGPASEYKESHKGEGLGAALTSGASVAITVATCAALNSCSSPGVVGNGVANNMTVASKAFTTDSGQSVVDMAKTNLVIHKICSSGPGGCASSAAASSDPTVTLDDLRKENAQAGLTTSIRLKNNY